MKEQHFYLLTSTGCSDSNLDRIENGLTQKGATVDRLVLEIGSDVVSEQDCRNLIEEVRKRHDATQTDRTGPVLIGLGLMAALALRIDALDCEQPVEIEIGSSQILIEDPEGRLGPVFRGVIALQPFLGFDFWTQKAGLNPTWHTELMLKAFRKPFVRALFGKTPVRSAHAHGLALGASARWSELADCLSFASMLRSVPSLKRPTVIALNVGDRFEAVRIQLLALNSQVRFLDCGPHAQDLVQATLRATEMLRKGLTEQDD
jgi:hypothetical protein